MTTLSRIQRVLLVDDEEDLVWSLVRRLQRALDNVIVDGKTQPEDALAALEDTEFDLLITDIRMPGMSGMELLVAARKRWPALPFVIMTAYPTEFTRTEALRLGSVSYVEKPFELSALVDLVKDVFARQAESGFSGDVMLDTLPDLVQLFTLSNLTGTLHLWRESDRGAVWFDRGNITHAVANELQGTAAFYEILTWSGGEFAMERDVLAPTATIFENSTGLIMEGLRRLDESRRAADIARPPSSRPSSSPHASRRSWMPSAYPIAELHTPHVSAPSESAPTGLLEPQHRSHNQEIQMSSNVQSALETLRAIDGYVGSCLVDSDSGMCLGVDGGGPVNLEIAAAGNTEVVRAKRKTMKSLNLRDELEDMLITLSKQYHIIRPMRNRPGVFFYVVVDRTRANLAMARLTLTETEKKLEL